MGEYEGIKYVLDLEACLYFANAGDNLKAALFQAASTTRIAVTSDVLKQLKKFNSDLADEFLQSDIEIVDCDAKVYQTIETLAQLLSVTSARLDAAANDKLPVIALVNCAQNGTKPKCAVVTGDMGTHRSSMTVLCTELRITVVDVDKAF